MSKFLDILFRMFPPKIAIEALQYASRVFAGKEELNNFLQKKYWDKQSLRYDYHFEPFRPDRKTVARYKKFLDEQKSKSKILLLGSTPELRDLLANYYDKSKIFINDFSWRMTAAMTQYAKKTNPDKEIWIKSDWLKNPFPEKYFDVVIGDLLTLQFHPEQEAVFLKEVIRILSDEGCFIMRCRFRGKAGSNANIENIFENAMKQFCGSDIERAATLLFWKIADLSAGDDRIVNREKIIHMIDRAAETDSNPLITKIRQKAKSAFENDIIRWTWASPSRAYLQNILAEHFNIEDEQISGEYDDTAGYLIYKLVKSA